jgi:hypothetical protein
LPNNDGPRPEGLDFTLNAIYGDIYVTDIQEAWLDIKAAKTAYIQIPFTVLVVAALYISVLHYRTKIFLWISVFVSFSFLLSISIYLQDYHDKYFCEECENPTTAGNLLKWFFVTLYVLTVVYVLLVICLFKDQRLPITVFKATTKIIVKNVRMMFLPTIFAGIIAGYILYWCYTFIHLYTTPNIIRPTNF